MAAVEGSLDAERERVDRFGVLGVAVPLVSEQALEGVLEVPLTELDLGLGPLSAKGASLTVMQLA